VPQKLEIEVLSVREARLNKTSVRFSPQYLMRLKCQSLQFVFVAKKHEKWLVIRRLVGGLAGWF
jgi:hypothetical protein